ncbi:YqcC family protein [Litorivivens sp.]|uniref:YqcC family protein n=1 Tax=Litorivivens sp. TaxID=2020868 RepID=UPI003566479E
MQANTEIASLLIDLEAIMRASGLWSAQAPDPAALASSQPFCVDTLDLAQWLQFVFIPRMQGLLEAGLPMPEKCEIKPVLEEGMVSPSDALLSVIGDLDEAITRAN